jgi:hypothetical protein
MSVSHKTYPRRCVCARIYEFAMDRLATAQAERMVAGGKPMEVTRARITQAGRRVLAGHAK